MIKTKLVRLAKVFLHICGLYVRSYKSPKHIFNLLRKQVIYIQTYELKIILLGARYANIYKFYNEVLELFVSNYNIHAHKMNFIGEGSGKDNSNTYRKIITNDRTLFEKIYFNDYNDFNRVLWFENNILVPSLLNVFSGDYITIIHYEFISKNLNEEEISIVGLKASIEIGRNVVTHAGLKRVNVLSNEIVIDWDNFGVYPFGFDISFIYFKEMVRFRSEIEKSSVWLNNNYKRSVIDIDFQSLMINFLFFIFVISFHVNKKDKYKNNTCDALFVLKEMSININKSTCK